MKSKETLLIELADEVAEKINFREHAFYQPELPLDEYLKWLHDWLHRWYEVKDE